MRIRAAAAAAAVLTIALALVFAMIPEAANAAVMRSAPPAPGYVYGVNPTALSASGSCSLFASGGWTKRTARASGGGYIPAPTMTESIPRVVTLGEPCYAASSTGAARIRVPWVLSQHAYASGATGLEGADILLNPPTSMATAPLMRCGSTEWTTPASVTTRSTSGTFVNLGGYGVTSAYPIADVNGATFFAGAICSFVVSIQISICTWYGDDSGDYTCDTYVWLAERWFQNQANNWEYGDDSPGQVLCELDSTYPGCEIYEPGTIDGTDFSDVCSGAPTLLFNDWSTLGPFIGHYARCLTVPANGMDAKGEIALALSHSSLITLVSVELPEMIEMAYFEESCGVVFNTGSGGILPNFGVNTCDWSSWAPGIKVYLVPVFWITGAWLYCVVLLRIFGGLWGSYDDYMISSGRA